MAITLAFLNGFSKLFHCWKKEVNFQQNPYNTSHHTFSMLPHYLAKLELRICGKFEQIQSKNRVTFDKNRNLSCHMAEYYHNSCSKCPPFARTHARRRPRHSKLHCHCQWWSGQCHAKHAENAASLHNTCLDKIVRYLQRIFSRNRKVKQQVSK